MEKGQRPHSFMFAPGKERIPNFFLARGFCRSSPEHLQTTLFSDIPAGGIVSRQYRGAFGGVRYRRELSGRFSSISTTRGVESVAKGALARPATGGRVFGANFGVIEECNSMSGLVMMSRVVPALPSGDEVSGAVFLLFVVLAGMEECGGISDR